MASSAAFEIRVVLCAAEPLPALRALDCPGIVVCDVLPGVALLPLRTARWQPHAVVLAEPCGALPPLLASCLRASPVCPPRVVACFSTAAALDAVSSLPHLSATLTETLQTPMALLSRPSFEARFSCAQRLLDGIGLSRRLLGYDCIARGAAWLSACPRPAPPIRYGLYRQLARQAGVTPAAVERRIRSAIESAWLCGQLAAQNRLFGLSVSAERGKPTNAELLFRLADRIGETLPPDAYTL